MFLLEWYCSYTNSDRITVKRNVVPPVERAQPTSVQLDNTIDNCTIPTPTQSIPPSAIAPEYDSLHVVRVVNVVFYVWETIAQVTIVIGNYSIDFAVCRLQLTFQLFFNRDIVSTFQFN